MFSKEIINLGVMDTPISYIPNARDFVFNFDFSNVNFIRVDIMNRRDVYGCGTTVIPSASRNAFNSNGATYNLNNVNAGIIQTVVAPSDQSARNIEHSFYFDIINNKILLNLRFVPPNVPSNQQTNLCAFADYTFRGF